MYNQETMSLANNILYGLSNVVITFVMLWFLCWYCQWFWCSHVSVAFSLSNWRHACNRNLTEIAIGLHSFIILLLYYETATTLFSIYFRRNFKDYFDKRLNVINSNWNSKINALLHSVKSSSLIRNLKIDVITRNLNV